MLLFKIAAKNYSQCIVWERRFSGNLPAGDTGAAGSIGSGKRNISSKSAWLAPLASFFACCFLMYCIISSSPRISSSSTRLDTGDGVDVVVCRLVEGEAIACAMLWLVEAIALRVVASEILGLSSLRPFDGDSAEKRWLCAGGGASFEAWVMDATEPVDDLRRPLNEIDSRFFRVLSPLTVEELDPEIWRGTRDVALVAAVDGDARTDCRCEAVVVAPLGVDPLSSTPNSLAMEVSFTKGDPPREGVVVELTITLALREAFNVGEFAADERPDIRGIFVGVSFVSMDEFNEDVGGGSFEEWCGTVPTLGEPAIVGRTLRALRSDVSDCFAMELAVWDMTRDVFGVLCCEDSDVCDPDFMLARRWAVAGGSAETCMGGIATGSTFLGCAEDNV